MRYIASIVGFILIAACSTVQSQQSNGNPVSHEKFTELLQDHVGSDGFVDYKGFKKDREKLNSYLELLKSTAPNKNWSDEEQIAYWINVYNAFTIDLVLQHYPVKSIKDIGSSIQVPFVNTPWDIKFIEIGGETYDLNNVEHGILRKKWEEPRIHFAVNCASYSCPKLRNEAFTAEKLNEQLDEQAKDFINDDFRNDITKNKAELSKIFDWFSGDFKNKMPVREFINQYADVKIGENTKVTYKEYDWKLNEQ
ncbi:MAG: DUF547 domain-containing protein [Marinoscillum sp.]